MYHQRQLLAAFFLFVPTITWVRAQCKAVCCLELKAIVVAFKVPSQLRHYFWKQLTALRRPHEGLRCSLLCHIQLLRALHWSNALRDVMKRDQNLCCWLQRLAHYMWSKKLVCKLSWSYIIYVPVIAAILIVNNVKASYQTELMAFGNRMMTVWRCHGELLPWLVPLVCTAVEDELNAMQLHCLGQVNSSPLLMQFATAPVQPVGCNIKLYESEGCKVDHNRMLPLYWKSSFKVSLSTASKSSRRVIHVLLTYGVHVYWETRT